MSLFQASQKWVVGYALWYNIPHVCRDIDSHIPRQGNPENESDTMFIGITALNELGIYIVTEGQIENFCPDLGMHGPMLPQPPRNQYDISPPTIRNQFADLLRIYFIWAKPYNGTHLKL